MRNKTEVGYIVSSDQFFCMTLGRLPTGYGRQLHDFNFQGGTIYNNDASSLIWVENQVSLGSNNTVMAKLHLEKWLWDKTAAYFPITTVTMAYLLPQSIETIETKRGRLRF